MSGNVTVREHEQNSDIWIRLIARDRDYAYADPTTIALVITEPDGTVTTKAKADMEQWTEQDGQTSTGHWRYKFRATQLHIHTFEWTWVMPGSPADQANETGYFEVV